MSTNNPEPFPYLALDVEGETISYTDVGAGPVLLFCHAGMWSLLWRDVIEQLCSSYRCIAFDPPGFGRSSHVPADRVSMAAVRDTVTGLIDGLGLDDVTLVMHDLAGPAALAAADRRPDRITAMVAVNTFGWRPSGVLLPVMLAIFGSALMRSLHHRTGWLVRASCTRYGVGRHWDRATKLAWRVGMPPHSRANMHRLFASARRSHDVYAAADRARAQLAQRPVLIVFGGLGDYLRFRKRWRAECPHLTDVTVPRGSHFPMCDDPQLTADAIATWHRDLVHAPRKQRDSLR